MKYPHWLMIAGAFFVVLGFIGLLFSRNRNAVDEGTHGTETKAKGK